MVDGAKVATWAAVIISTCAVVSCFVVVSKLCSEISALRDEFMHDMDGFNKLTNDAWDELMGMQAKTPARAKAAVSNKSAFDSIFRHHRAAQLPDHCKCGVQPNSCPPGPPGQPGQAGAPGEPGVPGAEGPKGVSGASLAKVLYPQNYECIVRSHISHTLFMRMFRNARLGRWASPVRLAEQEHLVRLDRTEPLANKHTPGRRVQLDRQETKEKVDMTDSLGNEDHPENQAFAQNPASKVHQERLVQKARLESQEIRELPRMVNQATQDSQEHRVFQGFPVHMEGLEQ